MERIRQLISRVNHIVGWVLFILVQLFPPFSSIVLDDLFALVVVMAEVGDVALDECPNVVHLGLE